MLFGVIDRIVDGKTAVLLVGEKQKQYNLPVTLLPEGAAEGTWMQVEMTDEGIASLKVDHDKTNEMRSKIKAKMELLRQRGRNR